MASANCARYVGADVGLVDIDPKTLILDLAQVPSSAEAVVAVHFAGLPVDFRAMTSRPRAVSYTHLRAHETVLDLVCRLLLENTISPLP